MFLPLETHGAVSVKTVNEKFVVWNISRVAVSITSQDKLLSVPRTICL